METEQVNAPEVGADTKRLTASEIETLKKSFAENGFFIVRDVVSRERLSHLRDRLNEEFKRMEEAGTLFTGGGMLIGHINCFPGQESRFIFDALNDSGIIDLIREVEPRANRMPNVGCNYNLPGSAIQAYHPDHDFTKAFMIANVAVVDTTLENGAMEAAPGTHKKFYKFWRFTMERPHRNGIRIPMQQGDVLVRTSNVWHRGMPNRTNAARPMVALTWEDGGSVDPDPFQKNGGQIQFYPNMFRASALGRLREKVVVAVPATYSLYRFVRSLFGNKGY